MRVTNTYCDRCGIEIKWEHCVFMDLCNECKKSLEDWKTGKAIPALEIKHITTSLTEKIPIRFD